MGEASVAWARNQPTGGRSSSTASMVKEWYRLDSIDTIDPAPLRTVAGVPGLRYNRGCWFVHRTHLPLLGCPVAPPNLDLPVIPFRLRPWQPEAVAFLRTRRGVLLVDEMRVGKSIESLAAWDPSEGQLCVIAPLAAHPNWLAWIRRRSPSSTIFQLEGRTYDPKMLEADVVLGHYEVLPAWQSLRHEPRVLILDEAHLLSDGGAKRTQAALHLAARSSQVFALTGSPLWNKPAGLYAILTALAPGAWGSWSDFAIRYCGGVRNQFGLATTSPSNIDEFRTRCSEIVFGRTWREIGIPEGHVVRNVREVALAWDDQVALDLALAEVVSKAKAGARLVALTRARQLLGKPKAKVAVDLALGPPSSVVVWAWHVGMAKVVASLCAVGSRKVFLVTGQDTAKRRQEILDAWRNAQGAILVATISVAQVGIDLSHAERCIFAELDFTPANIAQAEMRTFSPDRPMTVTYVSTGHAADRAVIQALTRKQADGDALGLRAAEGAMAVLGELFGASSAPDMERLFKAITKGREAIEE